jgi:hypothetical protein
MTVPEKWCPSESGRPWRFARAAAKFAQGYVRGAGPDDLTVSAVPKAGLTRG